MASEFPSASGIYAIAHAASGKRYVGSSSNLKKRIREHLSALRHNRHRCPPLQRAWDRHGEDQFSWEVIELCAVAVLIQREQHHLDLRAGYNVRLIADSHQGLKHTEATKAKLSRQRLGPEYAAHREQSRRRLLDPVMRATVVAAVKQRLADPVVRASVVALLNSPEVIANRIKAQSSDEYRAKMSAAKRGFKHTAEAREKIAASKRGRTHSPETIAKIQASNAATRARKRANGGI